MPFEAIIVSAPHFFSRRSSARARSASSSTISTLFRFSRTTGGASPPKFERGGADAVERRVVDVEDLAHDRLDGVPRLLVLRDIERAEGIAAHQRVGIVAAGQHHHVDGRPLRVEQPFADAEAVGLGHVDVEDQQPRRVARGFQDRLQPVLRRLDLQAELLAAHRKRADDGRIVVGDQHLPVCLVLWCSLLLLALSFAPAVQREGIPPAGGARGWCQGVDQILGLVGLLDEESGAGAERLEPCLVGGVGRKDDRRDVARVDGVLQPLQQREAVHHRHAEIEDDGVGRIALRDRQPLLAVEGRDRLEAGLARA